MHKELGTDIALVSHKIYEFACVGHLWLDLPCLIALFDQLCSIKTTNLPLKLFCLRLWRSVLGFLWHLLMKSAPNYRMNFSGT